MQPNLCSSKTTRFERARRANALSNIEDGHDVVSDDGGSEALSNGTRGTGDNEDAEQM